MTRWQNGERSVQFLIDRGRLESFEATDLGALADALLSKARLRVEATASAALQKGDVDGPRAVLPSRYAPILTPRGQK